MARRRAARQRRRRRAAVGRRRHAERNARPRRLLAQHRSAGIQFAGLYVGEAGGDREKRQHQSASPDVRPACRAERHQAPRSPLRDEACGRTCDKALLARPRHSGRHRDNSDSARGTRHPRMVRRRRRHAFHAHPRRRVVPRKVVREEQVVRRAGRLPAGGGFRGRGGGLLQTAAPQWREQPLRQGLQGRSALSRTLRRPPLVVLARLQREKLRLNTRRRPPAAVRLRDISLWRRRTGRTSAARAAGAVDGGRRQSAAVARRLPPRHEHPDDVLGGRPGRMH